MSRLRNAGCDPLRTNACSDKKVDPDRSRPKGRNSGEPSKTCLPDSKLRDRLDVARRELVVRATKERRAAHPDRTLSVRSGRRARKVARFRSLLELPIAVDDLRPRLRAVFLCLLNASTRFGVTPLSVAAIAKTFETDRFTVRRWMLELKAAGVVWDFRTNVAGPEHPYTVVVFQLRIPILHPGAWRAWRRLQADRAGENSNDVTQLRSNRRSQLQLGVAGDEKMPAERPPPPPWLADAQRRAAEYAKMEPPTPSSLTRGVVQSAPSGRVNEE